MSYGKKTKICAKNPQVSLELLAHGIEQYLIHREDMITQMFQTHNAIVLQMRKRDEWNKYLLIDDAVQVNLLETEHAFQIAVGGCKWASRGVVANAGLYILWPLLMPPVIALTDIDKMSDRILEFVDEFIMSDGQCISISTGSRAYIVNQPFSAPGTMPGFVPGIDSSQEQSEPVQNNMYSDDSNSDLKAEIEGLKCHNCGKGNIKAASFCSECGETIQLTCHYCNKQYPIEAENCCDCGEKLF